MRLLYTLGLLRIIENRLPSRTSLIISFFTRKFSRDFDSRSRRSGTLILEKNLMLLSTLNVCVLAEISKGDINGI
ncbi:MAG: hypothetical protein QXT26_08765 [Thermoproteota archaeon]